MYIFLLSDFSFNSNQRSYIKQIMNVMFDSAVSSGPVDAGQEEAERRKVGKEGLRTVGGCS